MAKIFRLLKKLGAETEGASLTEYAFLLALLALICISAITILGQSISSLFSQLVGSLENIGT
jgi:pilus assembly protein Flp/PilA